MKSYRTFNLSYILCLFLIFLPKIEASSIYDLQIINQTEKEHLGFNNCDSESNGEFFLLKKIIKTNDIILDIGANVGDYSDFILKINPSVNLFLFEPIPYLARKIANRFKLSNVKIIPFAVSNTENTTDFFYFPNDSGLSGLHNRTCLNHLNSEIIQISSITLTNFCKKNSISKIDFLKIDTEGNELNVLLGAELLLKANLIKLLQFEYGGAYLDSKTKLKEVLDLLWKYEYHIFRIYENGLIYIKNYSNSLENFMYSNYFAVSNEEFLKHLKIKTDSNE